MFPATRLRRLRQHPVLRDLVRETTLSASDFILPFFVRPGQNLKKPIASMPGHSQLSVDRLVDEVAAARELGIRAFLLFGIPDRKDSVGSRSWDDDGIVQQALRGIKAAFKDVLLITDECFCEYTDHGHCGPLIETGSRIDVDNDATLPNLAKQCVSHARAGADVVAPSGMMDGMVAMIRLRPRRGRLSDAADPELHMPPSTRRRLLRPVPRLPPIAALVRRSLAATRWTQPTPDEATLRGRPRHRGGGRHGDGEAGGEPISTSFAGSRDEFGLPTAAYNVSGEFAMVKAAAEEGLDRRTPGDAGDPDEHQASRSGHDPHVSRLGGGPLVAVRFESVCLP